MQLYAPLRKNEICVELKHTKSTYFYIYTHNSARIFIYDCVIKGIGRDFPPVRGSMGYSKNIAVIKGLKDGFSADGGALTGLVRTELYGSELKVEISLINFAALTEGRYVTAVTNGERTVIIEGDFYKGSSGLDTRAGFAALICYVNGRRVQPVASAICGNMQGAALTLAGEVERAENLRDGKGEESADPAAVPAEYSDEAIAEENYYEYEQAVQSQAAVYADTDESREKGREGREDEAHSRAVAGEKKGSGNFYERVRAEIEGIFKVYPKVPELEKLIKNSRWAKIDYGEGRYYVFGVLSEKGEPAYIAYGVPAESESPPESMENLAAYIPCAVDGADGFWVMYQDAATGESLRGL